MKIIPSKGLAMCLEDKKQPFIWRKSVVGYKYMEFWNTKANEELGIKFWKGYIRL